MDVVSLGNRTDLALLEYGGSQVEDRGSYLVVRTPTNPDFWWGNFLLLADVPHDPEPWLARFAAEFPNAHHVAIGFDDPGATAADLAPFAGQGFDLDVHTVMTADAVHPPRTVNEIAECRPLGSDDDWDQSVRLSIRMYADEPGGGEDFVRARTDSRRDLVAAGHGQWFGAFLDGRLVTQMGLFAAGAGLARFQSVDTDPDFRRQGLAGTLVHHVSRWGLDELGATTLVMVADPGYVAITLYRSVGFVDGESQPQVMRRPVSPS